MLHTQRGNMLVGELAQDAAVRCTGRSLCRVHCCSMGRSEDKKCCAAQMTLRICAARTALTCRCGQSAERAVSLMQNDVLPRTRTHSPCPPSRLCSHSVLCMGRQRVARWCTRCTTSIGARVEAWRVQLTLPVSCCNMQMCATLPHRHCRASRVAQWRHRWHEVFVQRR